MRTLALGLAFGWLASGVVESPVDSDRDGVDDSLEQELIERFRPQFFVDARECAELPAEFQVDSIVPRVRERNGTIYARVSPSTALGADVAVLELHYYHLWERDCGRVNSHALDVEHVSALIVAATPEASATDWTARYWYAAAHEGTVCDTSNAARADALGGGAGGPNIWISAGKHASYLSYELCRQRGCGGDDCGDMVALPPGPLSNLGEAGAPLGGAVWIASRDWPLAKKLGSDFDPELLTRLEASDAPVLARVNGHWRPAQYSISVGGDVIGALSTGAQHGQEGVAEAEERTGNAIGRGLRAIGRAFGSTARALGVK